MASSGGQPGNKNAVKAKLWRDAVLRAIARRAEGKGLDAGLDTLADKFIALCEANEGWAFKELGDRVDGKPAQQVVLNGDEDGGPVKVQTIEIKAVDP